MGNLPYWGVCGTCAGAGGGPAGCGAAVEAAPAAAPVPWLGVQRGGSIVQRRCRHCLIRHHLTGQRSGFSSHIRQCPAWAERMHCTDHAEGLAHVLIDNTLHNEHAYC